MKVKLIENASRPQCHFYSVDIMLTYYNNDLNTLRMSLKKTWFRRITYRRFYKEIGTQKQIFLNIKQTLWQNKRTSA